MTIRSKRLAQGIAGLGILTFVAACGGGATAGGEKLAGSISIDAPLSLTDAAAFAGVSTQNGMKYAIKEINSSHYLGAAELKVNYIDVGLANDQALSAVRGSIASEAVAVVGMTVGNQALAAAPVAQQSKVPFVVANSGGIAKLTEVGDYIYQTDVAQYLYADKMADELKNRGISSTAVLYNDDVPAVKELVRTYTDDQFPRVGIKVGQSSAIASTATDYSAAVTSIVNSKPDAVGVVLRGGTTVTVIKQLRQAGFEGQIWSQASLAGGVGAGAAPATNGVLFTANAVGGSDNASMNKFFSDYKKSEGADEFAFAAQGYDAIWAVARALKSSDCASRECVQKGLQELMKTGYSGALGEVTFNNRNAQGSGAIIEIVNGKETFTR